MSQQASSHIETGKRRRCQHCLRPISVCLCQHIPLLANAVNVLIYRHPSERHKAVGTAQLAAMGLQHCRLIDSEVVTLATNICPEDCLLVFPEIILPKEIANISTAEIVIQRSVKHLIFLDGTWKKARKMYYLSPELHTLNKLSLDLTGKCANYQIRKAEKPGQFSTLEAIAYALSQVEQQPQKYQPLLNLQQAMVDQQLAAMPTEIKSRYP
jgi:DTW domain-containing protein YfiP